MRKLAIVALLFLCGCVPFNLKKDMFGMGVQDILSEKNTKKVIAAQDNAAAFEKVAAFITSIDAVAFKSEPAAGFLVGCNFNQAYKCTDTSEVAFLVKPASGGGSEITIYSDNPFLMDFVAVKLGEYLTK